MQKTPVSSTPVGNDTTRLVDVHAAAHHAGLDIPRGSPILVPPYMHAIVSMALMVAASAHAVSGSRRVLLPATPGACARADLPPQRVTTADPYLTPPSVAEDWPFPPRARQRWSQPMDQQSSLLQPQNTVRGTCFALALAMFGPPSVLFASYAWICASR